MSSLMFRAAVGVVNTAARAANAVLTVMYPPDIGHIWDDSPREGVEAALTDPHPVGVDDPAADTSVPPPVTAAGSLTWEGWASPAILEALAEFQLVEVPTDRWNDWAERIAPVIADRLACDPTRAVLALTSLQKQ